jgi:hypothetical protein
MVPTELIPDLERDHMDRTEDEVTGFVTFKIDAGSSLLPV